MMNFVDHNIRSPKPTQGSFDRANFESTYHFQKNSYVLPGSVDHFNQATPRAKVKEHLMSSLCHSAKNVSHRRLFFPVTFYGSTVYDVYAFTTLIC